MPKTTVLRLLSVLERHGLVQREDSRYQLGLGIVSLAQSYLAGSTLPAVSRSVLEWLSRETGETASLYVRQGYERVVVQRVESPHALRYTINIGQHLPLHLGASGHVLAAAMSTEELEDFLDQVGEVSTASGGVLSRSEVAANLETVRRIGFSVSKEERELGAAAVAAPVYLSPGIVLAAVAVIGPITRMTSKNTSWLSGLVQQGAARIAEAYGWERSAGMESRSLPGQAISSENSSEV